MSGQDILDHPGGTTMTTTDGNDTKKILLLSMVLLILAAAIAAGSLLYGSRDETAEFSGADGQAEDTISEISADYEPWFSPLVGELPGEVESGLFALQAGLGGIVLGVGIGWYAGRNRGRNESAALTASSGAGGHGRDD